VGPAGIAPLRSESWTADDGCRPAAAGTYELRRGPTGGTLSVRGTVTDPVMDGSLSVRCD
jgi:hypothetical protein